MNFELYNDIYKNSFIFLILFSNVYSFIKNYIEICNTTNSKYTKSCLFLQYFIDFLIYISFIANILFIFETSKNYKLIPIFFNLIIHLLISFAFLSCFIFLHYGINTGQLLIVDTITRMNERSLNGIITDIHDLMMYKKQAL